MIERLLKKCFLKVVTLLTNSTAYAQAFTWFNQDMKSIRLDMKKLPIAQSAETMSENELWICTSLKINFDRKFLFSDLYNPFRKFC